MKYYNIRVQVYTKQNAPLFIGSTLRGAFGYALKKVVCINPSYRCDGCFAKQECLYYDFYESQNGYHNYRFDIELDSSKFDFALFLFEESCEKLPYVLSGLHKMLTEVGLMHDNLIFEEFKITIDSRIVYDGERFDLEGIMPQNFETTPHTPNLTLTLKTPLRIKRNNRFIRDDVALEDILRSIHQRERQLCYGEKYAKLEYTPRYTLLSKSLHHQTLIRKSGRQKSKMNMDGIMGQIAIENLDPASYRLLKLGEILGVGKQTVMGLGNIRVN
ncbi:MAG: CRISPR system precrRNA processing endoribonuclease RAMP protein Cas6 [Campylobacterota bacterium]|nr:CRISPR system precrRNA processing endoribonuclease RAMP protein Cas6 [Campylobacterota bacterium]